MLSINCLNYKFLQFKIMYKILSYRPYSEKYLIDTKFDICIKKVKNMQFDIGKIMKR